jgi:hypothetical protein
MPVSQETHCGESPSQSKRRWAWGAARTDDDYREAGATVVSDQDALLASGIFWRRQRLQPAISK